MIDLDSILAPISGENPAGENLRYEPVYDEIKEARRADDALDRGEWQQDVKTSDWQKVISLSVDALTRRTKDLQIAVWLLEGLIMSRGFEGFSMGLKVLIGLIRDFWDHVYPEIDEGDLDYRVGPLEFFNDKIWLSVKQIPITDKSVSAGYSWLEWQESRGVGYEKDIRNQWDDVDEGKKAARDEKIRDGKITAEEFDSAIASSSKAYFEVLAENVEECVDGFNTLDQLVDEKFGNEAPRLSDIKQALDDCQRVVKKVLNEKKALEPDPEPEIKNQEDSVEVESVSAEPAANEDIPLPIRSESVQVAPGSFPASMQPDSTAKEQTLWMDAMGTLKKQGIKTALGKLVTASCGAASVREENRYQLLIAKLCLKANRPDLARPVIEKLHGLIEELNLEKWESPIWIAEIIDVYYQILKSKGASDDDVYRANTELFQKLCITDITKAMIYKSE